MKLMPRPSIISQSDALLADIDAAAVEPGQLAIWWLGQHSFIVKTPGSVAEDAAGTVIYVDPFLSCIEGRLCPPLLSPAQITNATVICGTHDHLDHIDRAVWPALAAASPRATFVVPQLLLDRGLAAELAIAPDRFAGLDDGMELDIAGVKISAVAAAHEFLDRDAATGRYPYLGYIIETGGASEPGGKGQPVTLYHAGDTVWYEGLQAKLRRWKRFDAMLVPINGRDATRLRSDIVGNMTYQEAADLTGPLAPGVVIPTHYDMFAANPGDAEAFVDYMSVKYPAVATLRPNYGQRITLPL